MKKPPKKSIPIKDLHEKYRLLCDLMDCIPDVIYFKDRHGRLVMVNQAHARGLSLKPEQVAGKTDFDIFPKERAKKMFEDDLKVIKTGKPIIDKVERATRADGVDNYVSTTKIPRFDAKGKVIGLIGITRDITKRMQLAHLQEEAKNIKNKIEALEEMNRIKSGIISVVSHELRTPLAITMEAIDLVYEQISGPLNHKQKEVLNTAKNNVLRLKKMVDELLDMSRIESAQFRLRYSVVNMNSLLKDNAEFFEKLAKEKNIWLEYLLPQKQINIFLDYDRVNQIVTNLINNAIKFTERDGKITVELKLLENKVRVGVIDSGIGIATQDLPKLFNKFVQVSKKPEAEKKGVGLGLSIVKELVEKHGGEIWAESKLGVGSKFYFTLPLLYTTSQLSAEVKDNINQLMEKGIPLSLVNILVVNYHKFKARLKLKPKELFADIAAIINAILLEFNRERKEKIKLLFMDLKFGECSIICPQTSEEEVAKLCKMLKEKILEHIAENKISGIFINIGILSYPEKKTSAATQQLLANLNIKKVYIGAEIRRFVRISYKAEIETVFNGFPAESSQTIDISRGGVCFLSSRPLKTDSKIKIKLYLARGKQVFSVDGRVAWLKKEEKVFKTLPAYRIGVEFSGLRKTEKIRIAKFIKSISSLK
ncbi:MAG: ATP-binding protein [Candidatus Omnitrophica bacterium]|nr:ATP-binding protein [Candidatus Omnitrophota bacterium]